jgi:hypothetical protein
MPAITTITSPYQLRARCLQIEQCLSRQQANAPDEALETKWEQVCDARLEADDRVLDAEIASLDHIVAKVEIIARLARHFDPDLLDRLHRQVAAFVRSTH